MLDAPDHGEVANFGAGFERARHPRNQDALLGIGGAADHAHAPIDARRRVSVRCRDGGERRRRPGNAECFGPFGEHQGGGIEFVRPIRIARPLRTPRVIHRPRDLQRAFDLGVIAPHLAPIERPIGAVAELAARLEPFRAKAQRHHGEMHGRAADRLAAIVGAKLQRVVAVDDALVGPVKLRLMVLVGSKILERPPIRPGIERHDGKAVFGKLAGECAAAGAGADDGEIDRLVLVVLAHRHPAADTENVGRAPADRARGRLRVIRHGCSPRALAPPARAALPMPPRDRAGRNSSVRSHAGSPARRSRFRSRPPGARNRR